MVRVPRILRIALLCAGGGSALALLLAAAARVQLAPRFTPGETLRYQMDFRSSIQGRSSGPVQNPEAATRLELSVSAIVRIEVLRSEPASQEGESARLRATYEKSSATVRSDFFDPGAETLEKQYRRLEGHSIEFTLRPDGRLGGVEGLREILPDERTASSVRQWLSGFVLGAALPRRGIRIGQKWSNEQPVTTAPLAGIVWRSSSTYLRNESCEPRALAKLPGTAGAGPGEICAVIVTRLEMGPHHAPRDPTPEEYRRVGLRTSGRWTSSGESLEYISLGTGWVVSVTQTGVEDMDVTVASKESGSSFHYAAQLRNESQITLLGVSPAAPR